MLKRILLLLFAPLALSGCALMPAEGPSSAADTTVVDEQVALGVETMYQGWTAFVETGLDLGLIEGELAGTIQEYDRRIYSAVLLARQAYDAGNSDSYATAAADVSKLMAEAMALVKGT